MCIRDRGCGRALRQIGFQRLSARPGRDRPKDDQRNNARPPFATPPEKSVHSSSRRVRQGEKTNPCRAVKPEMSQVRNVTAISPANCLFSGLSLVSPGNATGQPPNRDETASQHRYSRRAGSAVLLRGALPAATNLRRCRHHFHAAPCPPRRGRTWCSMKMMPTPAKIGRSR